MSDKQPPEPEREKQPKPERDPQRLETWPALRAMKDYPEITEALRNPPEPTPEPSKPEPERKATTKDLEHRPPEPDPRNRPTIQGPGMGSSYSRPPPTRTAEPTPEGHEPKVPKQLDQDRTKVPGLDPLEEAKRRLAERGQAEQARERPSGRILELRRPGEGQGP